jgi:hypothetical protein
MVGSCFRRYRRCSIDCLPSPTGCWAVRALSAQLVRTRQSGAGFHASSTIPAPKSNSDRKLIEAAMCP